MPPSLLWHTRFGHTLYGATTFPSEALTMARYVFSGSLRTYATVRLEV